MCKYGKPHGCAGVGLFRGIDAVEERVKSGDYRTLVEKSGGKMDGDSRLPTQLLSHINRHLGIVLEGDRHVRPIERLLVHNQLRFSHIFGD